MPSTKGSGDGLGKADWAAWGVEPSPQVGAQVRGAVLGSQVAAVGKRGKPAAVGGSVVATVLGSQARVVAGSAAVAGSAGAVVADNNSRAGSHVRGRPCSTSHQEAPSWR